MKMPRKMICMQASAARMLSFEVENFDRFIKSLSTWKVFRLLLLANLVFVLIERD